MTEHVEQDRMREVVPDINKPGNLVFCVMADSPKLVSLLSAGIKPRGGYRVGASHFPNVVSLAAIGDFATDAFKRSTDHIWTPIGLSLLARHEVLKPMGFEFAFMIDPQFVNQHSEAFLFAGDTTMVGPYERLHKGKLLQIAKADPPKPEALLNEVHYLAGTLSPRDIVGAAICKKDKQYFEMAHAIIKSAVESVKQEPDSELRSPFALYNAAGELFDIAA